MKNLINEYRAFNKDEKDLAHSILVGLVLFIGFFWLVSTNTPPRVDHATTDPQTHKQNTYELKTSYTKYMNHVYNDKFK